ncbi:MAG: hypothetical protein DRO67_05570 [Candidatus Asgardarchaeum californiense]|nr:MAG: hypothetical protein DRO67_05570 [Candidatus Asgardarchaeum californiense]
MALLKGIGCALLGVIISLLFQPLGDIYAMAIGFIAGTAISKGKGAGLVAGGLMGVLLPLNMYLLGLILQFINGTISMLNFGVLLVTAFLSITNIILVVGGAIAGFIIGMISGRLFGGGEEE